MSEQGIVREYQSDGTFIDRPMILEEIKQNEKDYAEWLFKKETAEAARAAAEAKLAVLGLTTEDLKALGL